MIIDLTLCDQEMSTFTSLLLAPECLAPYYDMYG
jgi:hypothetical protein